MAENPIFSYTKRDYESSRQEGLSRIPTISQGEWTDLNASDPGIILLDYVHALVDRVEYYQDHQALESFITTAKERKNIFRLAKQLSYKVHSARGATCTVTFTSALNHDSSIKIPKYTQLKTRSGISYLTTEDSYLPANSLRVDIPCIQGELNSKTYTGTGVSRFSTDIENPENQKIYLTAVNIDVDSIKITEKDSSGNILREWTPIDYIIFATATDRVYEVELLPDSSVIIKFGDGQRGIVPKTTDNLTIEYITNSAEEGRVGVNAIDILESDILDSKGRYIEFSVSNNSASIGGSSPQSSDSIKSLAPGYSKAQDRAVTLSDFENLAKSIDGVADAKAYDINTNPDLCLYHEVKLLILPETGKDDYRALANKVSNYIRSRMIPPTNLQVFTPIEVLIDIDLSVRLLDSTEADRIEYDINQAVEEYFSSTVHSLGESFYPTDLTNFISNNVKGIRYIVSITPNNPVEISAMSIATLGKVSISIQ